MWDTVVLQSTKGLKARVGLLSPVVSQHTLATVSSTTAIVSHPFKLLMKANRREVGVGKKDEIMFRLLRVSVRIFPGLTDRPINLIYRVSPHPLTSSTGLLSNNELLRSGTIAASVPVAFVLQLLRWQHSSPRAPEDAWAGGRSRCPSCCFFMIGKPHAESFGLWLKRSLLAWFVSWLRVAGSALTQMQQSFMSWHQWTVTRDLNSMFRSCCENMGER